MSDDLSPAAQFAAAAAQAEAEAQAVAEAAAAAAAPAVADDSDFPAVLEKKEEAPKESAAEAADAEIEAEAESKAEVDAVAEAVVESVLADEEAPAPLEATASEEVETVAEAAASLVSEAEDDSAPSAAAAFLSAVDSAAASTSGDLDDKDDFEVEQSAARVPQKKQPLDLASEDLFPSLGAPATKKAPAWGAKSAAGPQSIADKVKSQRTTEVFDLPLVMDSVGDVARKIMQQTKTQIEISHNRVLKTSTYLVSGKPEDVARAKREICAKLSPQITKLMQAPASVRSQIFGVRGRTLQAIQTRTGTQIKMTSRPSMGSSDLFDVVDLAITGDSVGVAAAIAEIDAIVDQKTTKRAVRLGSIPHELNALLVGKEGATLAALQAAHSDVHIRIPGPIEADQTIAVFGERDAVQSAIKDIEETARQLLQSSQTVTVTVPKRQHRFIVGEGGATLKEIINATGCAILVPAPSSPSDQVTVRGAESNLVQALGLVMSKANSVTIETVDPTSIHAYERPLVYTQRALRYFHDRNRFRRIESENGVTLRIPSPATAQRATAPEQVQIEIQGKDARSVAAARQALVSLFMAFPPYHFNSIDVEPHLHSLLAGREGANVARLQASRSVFALFPQDPAAQDILVVYEGFNPDVDHLADRDQREKATRELLKKTLEEFRQTIQKDSTYKTRLVAVPAKLQSMFSKPTMLEEILTAAKANEGTARVVLEFGALPSAPEAENTRVTRRKDEVQAGAEEVAVKGLNASVKRVVKELERRVKEQEEYTRLHSFRDEFNVPQQILPRIIGRGGENIKRIRSERDVQIDIADKTAPGVPALVKLQGTAEDVAAVKAEILEFAERLADQTSEIISVPANIHRSLIGTGGRYVKRLEEKYAVRIQFPSSRRDNDEEH
ncbi:hypothetical protein EC988_003533, partial [Linderina pennispora]